MFIITAFEEHLQFRKKRSVCTEILLHLEKPCVMKCVPLTTISAPFADIFYVELNANVMWYQ